MTYQNLWDTVKAVLRGKFIVTRAYIKWTKRSQTMTYAISQILEKQEQANPKTSRKREIIKIRAKVNETEITTTTTSKSHTKSQ
jgi:hypothetical protein